VKERTGKTLYACRTRLIWDLRIQYAGNVGVQPNTGFDVASPYLDI
jgi:hypothetical protein